MDKILGLTYWPVQAAQLNSRESAFTLGKQSRTTAIYDGVRWWKLPEETHSERAARGLISSCGWPTSPGPPGELGCVKAPHHWLGQLGMHLVFMSFISGSSSSLVLETRFLPAGHVLRFSCESINSIRIQLLAPPFLIYTRELRVDPASELTQSSRASLQGILQTLYFFTKLRLDFVTLLQHYYVTIHCNNEVAQPSLGVLGKAGLGTRGWSLAHLVQS